MRKQKGLSLLTLLVVGAFIGCAMVLGFKLVPVYNEYFSIKSALKSLVNEKAGAPVSDIRDGFYRHIQGEGIKSIGANDLEITEDKSGTTIAVTYQAKVPLFSNVSLLFDFSVEANHAEAAQ